MSQKYYLKLAGQAPALVQRPYFTVGVGSGHNISLPGPEERILFSIHCDGSECTLIPGEEKIRINAKAINKPTTLQLNDKIEWADKSAELWDESRLPAPSAPAKAVSDSRPVFEILKRLSDNWEKDPSLSTALREALADIVQLSGAELGYLLSEVGSEGEWNLLACVGDPEAERQGSQKTKELISHTILDEAIGTKEPVYLESIVGHAWERQQSILAAKIFSLACLPLIVGGRVFGAVYLYTRTPGRSIRREALPDLSIVATQLALLLASQAQLRRSQKEVRHLRAEGKTTRSLIFDRNNPKGVMYGLDQRLAKLAASDLSILVRGETGTGKELMAREVHRLSARARGPFVAINCAAIPPTLMESTLFGSAKGAYTGSVKDRPGKFLQANGGTIFLDEIGDLSLELQVKLLRVLQEKEVEAVGADRSQPVDFRVVAATHQDLEAAVAAGKFRQDLFYRLNGATIQVPALRERGEDLVLLAQHFLAIRAPEHRISDKAIEKLKSHQWPGNVRELEQVIARAAALAETSEIKPEDLELSVSMPAASALSQDFFQYDDLQSLKEVQMAFTQDYVKRTLQRFEGNRAKVAGHLGISERTLYRLLSGEADKIV